MLCPVLKAVAWPSAGRYTRRTPEHTVLYRVVAQYLPVFVARAEDTDQAGRLPAFVRRECEAYLACGRLDHSCVHVRCERCGDDMVVAFSCKGRGVCPSCGGRRMSELAAQLVDRVIPDVPVRQWVLSLPWTLRYQPAFDAAQEPTTRSSDDASAQRSWPGYPAGETPLQSC